jgi:CheY-like chemotaxis protein
MRILVVEDEWLLRAFIADHLREAGCEVVEAANAETAVAILADGHDIDVVFTDIRLGGILNGWDVGEHARIRAADMPVLYTSGNPVTPRRDVAGSVYFSKPYDPGDILEACQRFRNAAP